MSRRSDRQRPEFVFVPIGGVGEIGMNLYLYGYGPPDDREWLIVDLGITFGGDTEPGIDVILPDITFLEAERPNLKGLLLTHAHEDHFGAVVDLWPRLGGVPVYATPFTASMLKSKLGEAGSSMTSRCTSYRSATATRSDRSTLSSSPCRTRSPSRPRS
jgi:ribonuclease J